MSSDRLKTAEIAKRHFGLSELPDPLGWGMSGYVYLSPDLQRVLKVHLQATGFARELEVYRRLRSLKMTSLHGLSVPKLTSSRLAVNAIEMDFVRAPYLLDFAGVLFQPPDYPQDTMDYWHQSITRMFGRNEHIVWAVYNSLARYGMYYVDFRPSNLNLSGLPGLVANDDSDDSEPY